MDDEACLGAVPEARRYAHLAAFARETAFTLGGRQVFAGMILHGGYGAAGPLSDLWVFDFGADETWECPWLYIGDSTLPLWGGAAGWDPTADRFVVAGGVEESGSIEAASALVWTWEPSNSASFFWDGTLPGQDLRLVKLGADNCDDGTFSHHWVDPEDDCEESAASEDADACSEVWEADGLDHRFGCTEDPACTEGMPYALLEASPAGRWQASSWMDPTTGELVLAGGTTGCRGAGCGTEVEDLYEIDPMASATLTSVNLPGAVAYANGIGLHEVEADYGWADAWLGAETDGTELTTIGLRGACASSTGWRWSRSLQEFDVDAAGADAAVFGGTFHHDLPQATQHHGGEVCLETWEVCEDHCITYDSTWAPEAPLFVDAAAGLVPAAEAWRDGDDGMSTASSSRSPVFDCAMAPTGSAASAVGEVLVVAGRADEGSTGSDTLWTSGGVTYPTPAGFGNRYGASAVYDVVSQRNYILGGTTAGAFADAVFRVSSPSSAAPDSGVTFTLAEAAVKVTQTAAGTWERESTLSVLVSCAVEACWARTMALVVPTGDVGELDTLSISVAVPGGSPQVVDLDRALVQTEPSGGGELLSLFRFPLPVLVTADTTLEVVVGWEDEGALRENLEAGLIRFGAAQYPAPAGSLGTTHEVGRPLAAWLPDGGGGYGVDEVVPISALTVRPLPGFMPITQGLRSEPAVGSFQFSGVEETPKRLTLYLLGGGQALPVTTSALGHPVYAFTDAPFGSAVASAAFGYVTTQLPGDLAWLEGSLSPLDRPHNLVLRAPTPLSGSGRRGVAFPGVATVNAGLAPATLPDPHDLRFTALHELAHRWFGDRRRADGSALWLQEGLCTLVAVERAPPPGLGLYAGDAGQDDSITLGMRYLIRGADLPDHQTDLEWAQANKYTASDDRERYHAVALAYQASTYVLAQLHAVHLATGGTSASFWAAMDALWDNAATRVDGAAVQATLDTLDGPADWFYVEWVADGRRGVPLVGLDQFVRSPAFPEPASPTGERHGPITVRVAQVQDTLFGWSEFSAVPYALLCDTQADPTARPFTQCSGTGVAPGHDVRLLSGASETILLTDDAAVTGGYGGLPANLYLVANHTVWPASLVDDGPNLHRQLLCAENSTAPACLGDGDGDGWSDESDCSPSDPRYFPGAPDSAPHTMDDENCDGWQCETRGPRCYPPPAL